MSVEPHVLIVSTALDLATDAVVRALRERGVRATRWNTEDFPYASQLTVAMRGGTVTTHLVRDGNERVELSDVTAVWYRRVRTAECPAGMDPGVHEFCLRESRAALLGALLAAIPRTARWMSDPTAVWVAEHKLKQLAAAHECGLCIPETVVTNDGRSAQAAFAEFDSSMIAKPARTGSVEVEGAPFAIFTSQVRKEDMADMHGTDLSPVIYQPLIEKRCDVRVTVVGTRCFVAEIESQGNAAARVDWRRTDDPLLPHRRGELPAEVEQGIHRLMSHLGLRFGALDFVATPDGRYVFLEVNPSGQWLWLDDQLDLGITEEVAAWLGGCGA